MHECYAMQILETKGKTQKNQRTKNDGHKGKNKETQGPRKPRQIRDTESHQLLNEESQTYFYQEVW